MTAASLRGGGTVPEFREELMVSVMSGAREVKQGLTRGGGGRFHGGGYLGDVCCGYG